MKALFVRLYLYIIIALFVGIFFSEYFVNSENYKDDLLVEHNYAIESIHSYLINELNLTSDTEISEVLDKWEYISGYEIEIINSHELAANIDSVLSRTKLNVKSIIKEIESLPSNIFWVGTDTDFFKDRTLVIAPHPIQKKWVAYSYIDIRTPQDNEIFIINQLSLLLAFSLALIIFLWPLVNTINALNNALKKFKKGELGITVPVIGPKPLALLNQQFNQMTIELKTKMEEQDLMTSAMSHELKSPITRLRFALDMAIKSDNTEDKNELLGEMDIDLSDLDNLTTELLTLAKVAGGAKNWPYETVNYRELIEQEKNLIFKYHPSINIKITGEASGVASAPYISRVFSNLLSNALKYAKSRVRVTLKEHDDRCYITIEDDGEGIPEQDLDKLFMPFYRVDSSRNRKTGGHGIGLAIVWNIVKNHQGDIQVDRSALGGLRVRISLPSVNT